MKKRILSIFLIVFMGLFLFGCEKKTKSISTTKSNNTSSSEVTKGGVSKTTNPYVTEKPTTTTTTASKTTLPLDLEGETFTIDCTALSGGTYTSNWVNGTYVKKSPTDSLGYSIGGYRVGNTYSKIVPDVSIYKGTAYEGREGAVYNVTPFNTIKALKVTYETERSNASDPRTPNVTFGTDKRCKDYKHVLSSSELFTEVTINVNGLDFNFFSFNSGDYYTTLKTIEVVYESTTSISSGRVSESGKNKVRLNPITYTGTKVPGETKVTVPTKVEYDSTTNTYKAVSEKEFTYYTYTYISNHPDEADNAAIIDPIEVCMYFTIFGTWPANYAEKNGSINVNTIRSVFGSKTRQVSIYNRTDGYATSVPWVGTGKYYELDINFDGTYSTGSRGSGRVVAWKDGFTATGYDNAPVCLYTDDHYNTWLEYYNNGTWSNRYDAEGNITGVSFSAATTVTLTGFDPKIVEGDPTHAEQGGGGQGGGGGTIPDIPINDEDYYANFAPAILINEQTAKWQQVTNMSGIVEGNKYYFVCGTGANSANYDRNIYWKANNGVLEYTGDEDWKDYYALNNPFYFEKVEGGYYLYKYDYNGDKVYYRFYDAKKDIERGQGLWQIKFSGGNFYLYVVKDGVTYALQKNNDAWRTYTSGTQQAIQLFRFCDIEGATPPDGGGGQGEDLTEYNSNFEKITSLDDINDNDEYIFVSDKYLKCIVDYNPNSKYKLDNDGNLLVSKDAEYLAFHIKKQKDAWNEEYYEVYVMSEGTKYYLTYLESSTDCYMNLSTTATYIDLFEGSYIFVCPAYMNDNGVCESYLKNGDWACLMYNEEIDYFVFDNITSENINNLVSIYKVLDDNSQQGEEEFNTDYEEIYNASDINEKDGYLFIDKNSCTNLTAQDDKTYRLNWYGELEVSTKANYYTLHFKKVGVDQSNSAVYEIYYKVNDSKIYLSYDEDTYKATFSRTPAYFQFNNGNINQLKIMVYSDEYHCYEHLYASGMFVLAYYSEEGFVFKNSSQNPYQYAPLIYKDLNDTTGGEDDEEDELYDSAFTYINTSDDIEDDDEYILIANGICLTDINNSEYIVDSSNNSLKVLKDAEYFVLHFTRKKDADDHEYFEIYIIKNDEKQYLSYDKDTYDVTYSNDPTPYYVDFINGTIRVHLCKFNGDDVSPVFDEQTWWYLIYDTDNQKYKFGWFDPDAFGVLYKINYEKDVYQFADTMNKLTSGNCVIICKDKDICLDVVSASEEGLYEFGQFEERLAFDVNCAPSVYQFVYESSINGYYIIDTTIDGYNPKLMPNDNDKLKCDFINFPLMIDFDESGNLLIINPHNDKVLRYDGENFKFYSVDDLEGTYPIQAYVYTTTILD